MRERRVRGQKREEEKDLPREIRNQSTIFDELHSVVDQLSRDER